MRIILLDRDAERASGVTRSLKDQNIQVTHFSNAEDAYAAGRSSFTAIVLENDLGSVSGIQWVQHFRQSNHGTPIIVLSEDTDLQAKVNLLDQGADEVIFHPVKAEILSAQIRALARRCEPGQSAVLNFEDLSLDLRSFQVLRQEQPIPCTSREVAVLEYLMRNRQRVVTRAELAESVWDGDAQPDSNVIEVFIARLRRKIDRPFRVPLIHTIVGRGYMLSETKPGMRARPQAAQT